MFHIELPLPYSLKLHSGGLTVRKVSTGLLVQISDKLGKSGLGSE